MKHGKHAPKAKDMPKKGKHAPASAAASEPVSEAESASEPASEPVDAEAVDCADQAETDSDSADSVVTDQAAADSAVDDQAEEKEEKRPRDLKALKKAGIIAGSVVAFLLVVYLAGALIFQSRFYPNTTMGDTDISLKPGSDIEALLNDRVDNYVLLVEGGEFSLRIVPNDVKLKLDAKAAVEAMLASRSAWEWPLDIFKAHDMTEYAMASFDKSALKKVLSAAVTAHNEEALPPTDATIAFDTRLGQFAIIPEALGTAIDLDELAIAAEQKLISLDGRLEIQDEQLLKAEILSDNSRLVKAAANANGMILLKVTFMLGDSLATALDAEVASDWIMFDENFGVSLNEEAMRQWSDEQAAAMSTYTRGRTYTRADGKVVTITGGVYGWRVDANAFYEVVKTAVETDQTGMVSVPVTQAAESYEPSTGRDWGNRYIDVDLSEQHARMYDEAGDLIWESDIVSGVPGNGSGSITPTGVYQITASPRAATLKGTDWDGEPYETPVRYWMPFVGNLIGLHDADWQWAFGGNRYQIGYGSHGCVNLPSDKAYVLSTILVVGDVVVVHW